MTFNIDKVTVCRTCGALLLPEAVDRHQEFHRDMAAINDDLVKLAKVVRKIVLERACERVPTPKELGL